MLAVIGEFLSVAERPFSYTDKTTGERVQASNREVKLFDSERDEIVVVSLGRDLPTQTFEGLPRGEHIALACYTKVSAGKVYFTATHLAPELLGKSVKAA